MSESPATPPSRFPTSWPIWQDLKARRLLMLGLLVTALHLIALGILLPGLPRSVPLRMDGAGDTLLSGPPSRLFLPPLFGLLAWLANAILGWHFYQKRREHDVAYLLWGASLVVQVAAWLSLLLILP